MKIKHLSLLLAIAGAFSLMSCEDNVSEIGGTIVPGEVKITVDSIETVLEAQTVYEPVYDARTMTKLLGRINAPEYGNLDCAFVTQMLSANRLVIPDSITVNDIDSMRLVMTVIRGSVTGDSLAPQQLKVFRLTKQLPKEITNEFDPTGYYDPDSPLGTQSYTLSAIAKSDSAFLKDYYIRIPVMLPKELAVETFNAYKKDPTVFQWPETFNSYFPGLYVKQNFGNGCIGTISAVQAFTYWHRTELRYEKDTENSTESNTKYHYVPYTVRDSIALFSSQPEVLSSNMVKYEPSQSLRSLVARGNRLITTPGGYQVKIKFPAKAIIDKYKNDLGRLSVISKLTMEIPAKSITNDFNIGVVPTLLMVKTSEREEFFNKNKIPDNKKSFYATYDSSKGSYSFTAFRDYIIELINKGEVTDEDIDFSLVPVILTTEDVEGYNSTTTYVTKCAPYIGRPTMTLFDMSKVRIVFTFSNQIID